MKSVIRKKLKHFRNLDDAKSEQKHLDSLMENVKHRELAIYDMEQKLAKMKTERDNAVHNVEMQQVRVKYSRNPYQEKKVLMAKLQKIRQKSVQQAQEALQAEIFCCAARVNLHKKRAKGENIYAMYDAQWKTGIQQCIRQRMSFNIQYVADAQMVQMCKNQSDERWHLGEILKWKEGAGKSNGSFEIKLYPYEGATVYGNIDSLINTGTKITYRGEKCDMITSCSINFEHNEGSIGLWKIKIGGHIGNRLEAYEMKPLNYTHKICCVYKHCRQCPLYY